MSRRIELPSTEQIEAAIHELSAAPSAPPLTVQALATHLGLTNSTFWRYFRDIAQSVADDRRRALRNDSKPLPESEPRNDDTEVRLRLQIAKLKAEVLIAAAQVQRLTLENEALRRHVEAENRIVRLSRD